MTFVDNRQIRRRLPAFSEKEATNRLGEKIQKLLDANGVFDKELQGWFTGLVPKVRDKILEYGLIDKRGLSEDVEWIKTMPESTREKLQAILPVDDPRTTSNSAESA